MMMSCLLLSIASFSQTEPVDSNALEKENY